MVQRILYCSENYSPHDYRFLSALASSDREILWLCLDESGRQQENRPLPDSIQKVSWRIKNDPVSWSDYSILKAEFGKVVKKIAPDIIHAGPIQRVAYLPALINFHPLLTMSWGFDLLEDVYCDEDTEKITRFVLERSDWFTSDCQTTRNVAVNYGMQESRTVIFPWGVDLDLFSPDRRSMMRRQVGFAEDLLIVHTRSWEPRYGVDVALNGIWQAFQIEPQLRLFMLGGGSQEEQIKSFVIEKGLSDRVHFFGFLHNEALAGYYQAADVYLSASHIDGSSVALMESMACGCPALVSDIPANLEWIEDGKQGWTFKDGDSNALARKIIHIANNRQESVACGKNARAKTELKADWRKNFAKLLDLYDRMLRPK